MKALGEVQFQQKSFKYLDLKDSPFKGILGKAPANFIAVAVGASGNGKTEFCLQLAMALRAFGKVGWFSYEQGHSADLQAAHGRYWDKEYNYPFILLDPMGNITEGIPLIEDLCHYLDKKNSPKFVFIDSYDMTGFTWSDYLMLKARYGKKKSLIFIVKGSKNCRVLKKVCDDIYFDGQIGIHVIDYIATPDKNRYGGEEPYVIYEKRARARNPLFFATQLKENGKTKPTPAKDQTKLNLQES